LAATQGRAFDRPMPARTPGDRLHHLWAHLSNNRHSVDPVAVVPRATEEPADPPPAEVRSVPAGERGQFSAEEYHARGFTGPVALYSAASALHARCSTSPIKHMRARTPAAAVATNARTHAPQPHPRPF
jgi:hypothetical protein